MSQQGSDISLGKGQGQSKGREIWDRMRTSPLRWPLLVLFALLVFNLVFNPHFFQIEIKDGHLYGSLIDILNRAAPVLLMAMGMTLVIATGGIDISVGSVMAVAGSIAGVLLTQFHLPLPAVILIPLLVAGLLGAWNGFMVAVVGIQPIVVTLILFVAGRGIAELITDGQIVVFENRAFEYIGNGFLFGLPFTIAIVASVFLGLSWLTRGGALGMFIEAVGGNARSSYYAGIKAGAVKVFVYTCSAVCAGGAGLISAATIKAADPHSSGLGLELNAILSVVIGGTSMNGGKFSLAGTVVGALILQGLLTTILTQGVPVQANLVIEASVVLFVCLIQSPRFRQQMQTLIFRWTRSQPSLAQPTGDA